MPHKSWRFLSLFSHSFTVFQGEILLFLEPMEGFDSTQTEFNLFTLSIVVLVSSLLVLSQQKTSTLNSVNLIAKKKKTQSIKPQKYKKTPG